MTPSSSRTDSGCSPNAASTASAPAGANAAAPASQRPDRVVSDLRISSPASRASGAEVWQTRGRGAGLGAGRG
jgi:hypothetical protein